MSDLFHTLVKTVVAPLLKSYQFTRRGNAFLSDRGEIIWYIGFQRSTSSTRDVTSFTINVGLLSKAIACAYGKEASVSKLVNENCHIRQRIGFLMEESSDVWFTIDQDNSLETVGVEINSLLKTVAVPFLSKFEVDAALYEFWTEGNYAGNTELGRLANMLALAVKFGDESKINEIVRELTEKSENSYATTRLLQKLGLNQGV